EIPILELPSRVTTLVHKLSLREFPSNSTSLTITTNQTIEYLCIAYHFIDHKWKLYTRIIRFLIVETPHDYKNMFNAILKALHK
ncbi:Os09g0295850, partial [Oryza sativa Japonica Group]